MQVAEEFGKDFPNVEVTVGLSGTGGGFKKFMAGSTDISDASRPVKGSEIALGKENNIEFIELPVAYDGLSIVVNPANDFVDQLTVDQLKKIFLVDQAAKTWQEVNPEWPEEEIKLFIPGTDSGTFDYFKEVVAGKEGTIRGDEAVSTDENDNNLVAGVEKNEFALGFFGAALFSFISAKALVTKLRWVPSWITTLKTYLGSRRRSVTWLSPRRCTAKGENAMTKR